MFITEETKQCSSIVQDLYKVVQEKSYPNDAIERIVQISDPGNCDFIRKGLAQALSDLGGGRIPSASPSPSASPQTPGPPEATTQGWVAVGLQGGDMNFDLANGAAVPAQIPLSSKLKARTQVNVRPGPADWSRVSGLLAASQCFEVEETRALKAGDHVQTWARGKRISC